MRRLGSWAIGFTYLPDPLQATSQCDTSGHAKRYERENVNQTKRFAEQVHTVDDRDDDRHKGDQQLSSR